MPAPLVQLEDLFSRRAFGIRLGLTELRAVHDAMGHPASTTKALHVVGTNGKGSVCAMAAHALRSRGYRVGLYTSPHLHSVTERVQIDGQPVAREALEQSVARVIGAEPADAPRPLSFFEVLTLAALDQFARAGVDVVVAEAGLGGRLDATRLVSAAVVGVTSIALDHQAYLGDTLAKIAAEKAAVFRPGGHVVTGEQEPEVVQVLEQFAAARQCRLQTVAPTRWAPEGWQGKHQRQNAAIALACARSLDPDVAPSDFEGARWPGRLESIAQRGLSLVVDVAHNPAAIEAMVATMEPRFARGVGLVLFGCQPDKDAAAMIRGLERLGVPVWWVGFEGAAAPPPGAVSFSSPQDPRLWSGVTDFVGGDPNHTILVCGSHHLVGAVRRWMMAPSQPDQGVGTAPDPQDPRGSGP